MNGAPVLGVEVRSEGDYGPNAERDMADGRALPGWRFQVYELFD